jgi:ZIP family zinc transporter
VIGALVWGLVAGSAFVLGGLLALRLALPSRTLGLLIGFGSGALIAAVAYELVDEAGRLSNGSGHVAVGLVIGSLASLFAAGYWEEQDEPTISFRSLVINVVPEAVIIVGSLLSGHHIGAAVIIAIFLCGVPEAFLATGRLTAFGLSSRAIILIWIGMAVLCGVSAGIAYALLDGAREGSVALVLSIAGGAVLTELTTDLVPEGRALGGPLAGTTAVIGFALVFALVEVA